MKLFRACFCVGLFLLLFLSHNVFASTSCKVAQVVDGDTLLLSCKEGELRLYGLKDVDAPELNQPYGLEAKEYLSELVKEGEVWVNSTKGRYLKINNSRGSLNTYMVYAGYAWGEKDHTARKKKIGLWQDKHPVRPDAWRKNNNMQNQEDVAFSKLGLGQSGSCNTSLELSMVCRSYGLSVEDFLKCACQ